MPSDGIVFTNSILLTHKEICFDIERDNGSAIRFVDIRADDDRTSSSRGDNFRTLLGTVPPTHITAYPIRAADRVRFSPRRRFPLPRTPTHICAAFDYK